MISRASNYKIDLFTIIFRNNALHSNLEIGDCKLTYMPSALQYVSRLSPVVFSRCPVAPRATLNNKIYTSVGGFTAHDCAGSTCYWGLILCDHRTMRICTRRNIKEKSWVKYEVWCVWCLRCVRCVVWSMRCEMCVVWGVRCVWKSVS